MNNRQKAKHWKRLYEEHMAKPVPVVYQTVTPNHYTIKHYLNDVEYATCMDRPDLFKNLIVDRICRDIRPVIEQNFITEKDIYTDRYIYSFDFYV